MCACAKKEIAQHLKRCTKTSVLCKNVKICMCIFLFVYLFVYLSISLLLDCLSRSGGGQGQMSGT